MWMKRIKSGDTSCHSCKISVWFLLYSHHLCTLNFTQLSCCFLFCSLSCYQLKAHISSIVLLQEPSMFSWWIWLVHSTCWSVRHWHLPQWELEHVQPLPILSVQHSWADHHVTGLSTWSRRAPPTSGGSHTLKPVSLARRMCFSNLMHRNSIMSVHVSVLSLLNHQSFTLAVCVSHGDMWRKRLECSEC